MKKKKTFNNVYIVIVAVLIVFVVGFNVSKAQTSEDGNLLDKIMYIFMQLKAEEINTNVEPATLGMSTRTDTVIVSKKVDYDDITTTGADVTNVVLGDFYVENIVLETGDNTLASGTLLQVVTSGDDYGTSTVLFSTQVSNFPKATTMDLDTPIATSGSGSGYASSTQRVILEDGSKLIVKCTVASCMRTTSGDETGTGYLRIHVLLKRVDNYSQIYD